MTTVDAKLARRLSELVGARYSADTPLGPLTTLRVGGRARHLVRACTLADLHAVHSALQHEGHDDHDGVALLVIGQGSNLLVGDAGFEGIAVVLDGDLASWELEGALVDGAGVVRAGGALKLPVLARQSVRERCGGLEWMVGIPGSVGGAVRMNAGGHGSDVAAVLIDATVMDLRAGSLVVRPAASLGLRYRHCDLGADECVVSARFRVHEGDPETGEAQLGEIVRWRRDHQPGGANCGSVFTNPPGISAGRMIDAAGLKGFRIGTASVSTKHANFIQADDHALAADVWALIIEIRRRVFEVSGVQLTPEVRTVGFDAVLPPLLPSPAETGSPTVSTTVSGADDDQEGADS